MAIQHSGSLGRGKSFRSGGRRTVAVALLLALWLLVPGGCRPVPEATAVLTVGMESEPERLDPLTQKNPQTLPIMVQLYEGLVGLGERGEVVPLLAERWETRDFRTWTFHLRRDAYFHRSGLFGDKARPVTAHDAAAALGAFCSPAAYPAFVFVDVVEGCADYNAGRASSVRGFEAVDDRTLRVHLVRPERYFPHRLTSAWIAVFPREALDPSVRDRWGLDLAVGTGPFRLERRTDTEVVLVPNERYWDRGRVPRVGRVVFRVVRNDRLRLSRLLAGEIDLMVLPPSLYPSVLTPQGELQERFREGFQAVVTPTFNVHLIGINLDRVPDVHLRRALYYGTDRLAIVRAVLFGHADEAGGAIPPGLNGYVPPFSPGRLYDPERARADLARSGYDGRPLELLVHDAAASEQVGQVFQQQMGRLGVRIRLTRLDFNSVINRMVRGEAELFSMFFEYVFSTPEVLLDFLFSSRRIPAPNFWHYANPTVDQALDSLRLLPEGDALRRCADIERQVMEDVPAVFLYRQHHVLLLSKKFRGIRVNGYGHYLLDRVTGS